MPKFSEIVKNVFWVLLLIQIAPPIISKISRKIFDTVEPKNKVGLVVINSTIMTSSVWTKQLKRFFKDPEIKAILIKFDSPGGAAGSSEAISKEIIDLKKEYPKPIISYAENICASGAYMIAATTDYIVAPHSALIGSIGAKLSTQFKFKELFNKYDIKTHSIASGTHKNATDPFVPMSEEQQKMLQAVTDDSYQQFAADISKYRHLNINEKNIWGEGKIFTGTDALKLNLIDEIGNQSTALNYIKKHILHEDREIELIKIASPSAFEKFLYPDRDEDDDEEMQNKLETYFDKLKQNLLAKYQITF
jgi:protease-4